MDNASLAAEAFERGLSSFRRKQYDAARVAWEEAVRLAPEERRYSVNLEKLRRLLKEQR
jgi:tetratricopeptide (TPR) repeat protein